MKVQTSDATSAIIDGIIKFVAAGGFITTALVAPNAVQIFDKPLDKLMDGLDKRSQERELRRITHYMKSRGLIRYDSRDYEHGIVLTKKGKQRLIRSSYVNLTIPKPQTWDRMWRLIFFDIPEPEKNKRNALNLKLKQLGFKQLQISIWVHPFPARIEIEAVTEALDIRKYVTYVEIAKIDSEKLLRKRFRELLIS